MSITVILTLSYTISESVSVIRGKECIYKYAILILVATLHRPPRFYSNPCFVLLLQTDGRTFSRSLPGAIFSCVLYSLIMYTRLPANYYYEDSRGYRKHHDSVTPIKDVYYTAKQWSGRGGCSLIAGRHPHDSSYTVIYIFNRKGVVIEYFKRRMPRRVLTQLLHTEYRERGFRQFSPDIPRFTRTPSSSYTKSGRLRASAVRVL